MKVRWLAIAVAIGLSQVSRGAGIEPADVCVIVNKNMPESREVGAYYMKLRKVPAENLISLDIPGTEDISRADYDSRMAEPLRKFIRQRTKMPKVLLTVYGVPLRVGRQAMTDAEKESLAKVNQQADVLRKKITELKLVIRKAEEDIKNDPKSPFAEALPATKTEMAEFEGKLRGEEQKANELQHAESQAAVDSELMLVLWDGLYPLYRWVENPLYLYAGNRAKAEKRPVLMTCRLDGPNPETAKRLVDDALAAEKTGLAGKVYVDARGLEFNPEKDSFGTGYGGYDESFREAAELLVKEGHMDVVLENTEKLFDPGECTDCAIYCGWYSVRNYRPCCKFVKGAVAWHLASFEAVSLRNPGSQWCGNLLRDGAAATLGPVDEPYTVGFPKPEEFFGLLATGKHTLVECYAKTSLLTSWMMTLVGDPLYVPFAKSPRLMELDVLPSPRKALRIR